ncbi:phage head-tail joining protein [Paracoccus mutanolyticus]
MYTVEQYQTLCRMIGKGVTSLEVNGEKVSFRSLAEMLG